MEIILPSGGCRWNGERGGGEGEKIKKGKKKPKRLTVMNRRKYDELAVGGKGK
jgi:hypothetical protein